MKNWRKELRESLIKQGKMLSKASQKGMCDDGLSNYSKELLEIYKELNKPVAFTIGLLLFNFFVYLFVFIPKFGRRKT